MKRREVFQIIDGEREHQILKNERLAKFSVAEFLLAIGGHVDEAGELLIKNIKNTDALKEIREIAALAVACMELYPTMSRSEQESEEESKEIEKRREERKKENEESVNFASLLKKGEKEEDKEKSEE